MCEEWFGKKASKDQVSSVDCAPLDLHSRRSVAIQTPKIAITAEFMVYEQVQNIGTLRTKSSSGDFIAVAGRSTHDPAVDQSDWSFVCHPCPADGQPLPRTKCSNVHVKLSLMQAPLSVFIILCSCLCRLTVETFVRIQDGADSLAGQYEKSALLQRHWLPA